MIVSKLFDLIKMDIKKTRDIICHFQKDNEINVIEKLNVQKEI